MSKILLVEDEAIELKMLDYVLSNNHNVVCAHNGIEAFNILKLQKDFDLIISDVNMDQMDGIELKNAINQDNQLNKIPFMFLTHISDKNVEKECLELGADLYLHKPFVKFDILKEVDKILGAKSYSTH